MRIAILGGTGKEGSGLALRWARHAQVMIGSRRREKAEKVAAEVNARLGADLVTGRTNREAAEEADIAVLTVPKAAHAATLADLKDLLKGKPLIDTTVPLDPTQPTCVSQASTLSAAEEAQEILGAETHLAAAFQTVAFKLLHDLDHRVEGDVLVCSDYDDAMRAALYLARLCGFRSLNAGRLCNARVVEGLTPLLIHINRIYKTKHAGFLISGLDGVDWKSHAEQPTFAPLAS